MKRIFIAVALLIIILLALSIYSNSLSVPFQFDDVKRIVDIKAAQDLNIREIFHYSKSRFLLYLTLALNFYFGRHNVFGYHFLNLIIHIVSSILVFFLCLSIFESPRLEGSKFKKNRFFLSLFSALIFAVHPIQTESVTYIWQRGESMAGMFYLLSLTLYAKFRLVQIYNPTKKDKIVLYLFLLVSIVLCSLTKPTSLTLPVAILVFELCFLSKNFKEFKGVFSYLLPILILTIFPVILAHYDIQESRGVGIRFSTYYMPYYYTKLRVLVNAIRLFVFPIHQRIEYDFSLSSSLVEPISTLYSFLFLVFLIVIAILAFKRYSFISFAISWCYLTLSLTTILYLEDLFFEHYLYLPLFGYALLLPVLSLNLVDRMQIDRKYWMTFFIVIAAIYSIGTYNRNRVWQTEISLWEDAVKKSPHNARANYTLGVYYFRAKRYEGALERYRLALMYKPEYPEAYYRLGEYYFSLSDIEKSIANYRRAIEINPEFFEAYLNLGSVYLYTKQYKDAKMCFNNALRYTKEPDYIKRINNVLREIE